MKIKSNIKPLIFFVIFTLFISTTIGATTPDTVKINTEKGILNTVQYEDFDLNVERIKIEGSNSVVYCSEINKKYPSGQKFSLIANGEDKVTSILSAGYPNRSVAELNLSNENEAYFATQIAMWCSMEGYDVNLMRGANPKILEAIKNIYNDGISRKYSNRTRSKIYKTSDENIQEVVIISYEDLMSEVKAESEQNEYAPQEG